MKHLALYLCAPLQSWGSASQFGERATFDAPTRSGILGLLAAACGIDKNDEAADRAWLARAADLSLAVFAFARGNRMTDFHTVGARYDKDDPWQKRMIPVTADAKPRGTDLTRRDYLADSTFGAVLSGDDAFVDEIAEHLANPVWGVWLGRKSCIPTEPLLVGVFSSEEAALDSLQTRHRDSLARTGMPPPAPAPLFTLRESSPDAADETLLDIPVSFSHREFHARTVHRDA